MHPLKDTRAVPALLPRGHDDTQAYPNICLKGLNMLNIGIKKKTEQTGYLAEYVTPEHIRSCYTCGGCNTVCAVNTVTGSLRPMKLIHMANFGFMDELLAMPDIWYCMNCSRCTNLCPMMVQSSALFQNLRAKAVLRKIVPPELPEQQKEVVQGLISVLWHAASALLNGESPSVRECWDQWVKTSPSGTPQPVKLPANTKKNAWFLEMVKKYGGTQTALTSCFTCRECSSTCPVCMDSSVFDPLRIVRSANFALKDELLRSPTIWLCLDCRSCIPACSQGVKISLLIRELQYISCTQGFVPKDFPTKWMALKKEAYAQYIDKIDALLSPNKAA